MDNLIEFAKEKKITLDCIPYLDGFNAAIKKMGALIDRLEVAVEKAEKQDVDEVDDPLNFAFLSDGIEVFRETDIPDYIKCSDSYQKLICDASPDVRIELPKGTLLAS